MNFSFFSNTSSEAGTTYDMRGIVEHSIHTIKEDIENYLKGVDEIIAKIDATNVNVSSAFKGEAQIDKVSGYLGNSVVTIKSVTTEMRKFIDALQIVQDNYHNQSGAVEIGTGVTEAELDFTTGVNGFGD